MRPQNVRLDAANRSRIRSPQFVRLIGWLGILLPALFRGSLAHGGQSVGLAWDASPDPNVVGYKVYVGVESGNYTNVTSIGNVPSAVISNLVEGATYYFAVTAMDAFGQESYFSNEASYTVPALAVTLQISATAGGAFRLTATGRAGRLYAIQATTNFVGWTTIGTQTAGLDGSFAFTDGDAPNRPARFYRTLETLP